MNSNEAHLSGQSVDDAVALLTLSLSTTDERAALRAEIVGLLATNDVGRIVAAIEMLALSGATYLHLAAQGTGRTPNEILAQFAIGDQILVPRQ